jgi:hypothetical protein
MIGEMSYVKNGSNISKKLQSLRQYQMLNISTLPSLSSFEFFPSLF